MRERTITITDRELYRIQQNSFIVKELLELVSTRLETPEEYELIALTCRALVEGVDGIMLTEELEYR